MTSQLYIANFPVETTEEQMRDLLAEFGEIMALELGVEERTGMTFAVAEMASEKVATKAHRSLNGYVLEGQSLSVSYPEAEPRELTVKQRKAVEEVIATLEETNEIPLRQIEAMARLCGLPFIEALVKEALEIDAQQGIMTTDASRRRTKGGVFFYLARYRMSPAVRRWVYNRKGKLEED